MVSECWFCKSIMTMFYSPTGRIGLSGPERAMRVAESFDLRQPENTLPVRYRSPTLPLRWMVSFGGIFISAARRYIYLSLRRIRKQELSQVVLNLSDSFRPRRDYRHSILTFLARAVNN